MSHLPERKEKICLNCKSVIYGRFCHICGQENTEPKETFWGLITHFIYDITHFDGKFFDTTKYLLFRPGYLAYEYLRGRRAAYLNPIRMYVFTSAIFFIIFFAFINKEDDEPSAEKQKSEWIGEREQLQQAIALETDSVELRKLKRELRRLNNKINIAGQYGILKITDDADSAAGWSLFSGGSIPATVAQYDSLQAALPAREKDGWLWNKGVKKAIALNNKYRGKKQEFYQKFNEKFSHSLPQMMFVSLPLVALILQLLYIRRRQYYYVSHLIFTLNIYIAIYLLILVFYALSQMYGWTGMGFFRIMGMGVVLSIFWYVYKSMRNFYNQRRAKTVLKYFLFILAFFFLFGFLMTIYFFTSALQI